MLLKQLNHFTVEKIADIDRTATKLASYGSLVSFTLIVFLTAIALSCGAEIHFAVDCKLQYLSLLSPALQCLESEQIHLKQHCKCTELLLKIV